MNRQSAGYRWLIFWIIAFGYVLVYFHRLCPAIVAVDMMRDLKAGGALIGFLAAAYFYPYAVMQLPAGLLSDSWGPRKTITVFFIVAFLGSILLGIAPSASWAIIGRTLVGFGVAMLFVPAMKILAEWFTQKEFAFMTGILMAMGGIGSLTAATPLALLSAAIGWRMSFLAVGGFTLLLAVLVWRFVQDRPESGKSVSNIEKAAEGPDVIGLMDGVRRVLTTPAFWPLAVWFFFDCAIFFCLTLGIFSSAIVVIGFTANKELFPVQITGTATGLVNLFPFAGGAVFQPILGYTLEKYGKVDGMFTVQGYRGAFSILLSCAVVAIIASFFIKETLGSKESS